MRLIFACESLARIIPVPSDYSCSSKKVVILRSRRFAKADLKGDLRTQGFMELYLLMR